MPCVPLPSRTASRDSASRVCAPLTQRSGSDSVGKLLLLCHPATTSREPGQTFRKRLRLWRVMEQTEAHMRRIALVAMTMLVTCGAVAAADLGRPAPVYQEALAGWTGFYLGFNVGG